MVTLEYKEYNINPGQEQQAIARIRRVTKG